MKYSSTNKTPGVLLAIAVLLGSTTSLAASPDADQAKAEEARVAAEWADLQASYQVAAEEARRERQIALEAIERARAEMLRAAEDKVRAHEDYESGRDLSEAESAAMRAELSRVHDSLRQASREVARVHRELNRTWQAVAPSGFLLNLGDKAIIGVILGGSSDEGVPVLGVSPDGPAERAGLLQGDIIISMMGESLADDPSNNPRDVLGAVMEGVKVGDELVITVERDGEQIDYTVIADKREPFSWQSIIRLPSAPALPAIPGAPMAPGSSIFIERIQIPQIDEEALHVQIEKIREGMDRARVVIKTSLAPHLGGGDHNWEFQFDTESFSDFGDEILRETNIWFGLPVTRGLKLAEIDAGLGTYFRTERGVLVLKARENNDLHLQSGDVILQVSGKDVDKPSDVIRALRDWQPGANIEIQIKRERKDMTLDIILPERTSDFGFVPGVNDMHFKFFSNAD